MTVPVQPGLNRVFVRLAGAGSGIKVSASTALSVCLASGPVGFPARFSSLRPPPKQQFV